jgi:Family of unknown function (DUF5715)
MSYLKQVADENRSSDAAGRSPAALFCVQLSDQAASGWVLGKTRRWAYTEVALVSPHTPTMLRNVFFVLVLLTVAATSTFASTVRAAKAHSRVPRSSITHGKAAARHSATTHAGRTRASRSTARPRSRRAARANELETRHPRVHARLRRASLRRMVIPPSPLRGSLESLTRQNELTSADGLERILDETDLANRISDKMLVPVPESSALEVSDALTETHRYCRPWTAEFLKDLSRDHSGMFGRPLYVSSAVRTVEYQKKLMRHNHNAAAAEGDIVSPHLTGATIDIAKKGMSRAELKWMRDELLPMQQKGIIDVEEEFRQACFHITVYKAYLPPPTDPQAPSASAESVLGQPSR